jgi:hypothetical protein
MSKCLRLWVNLDPQVHPIIDKIVFSLTTYLDIKKSESMSDSLLFKLSCYLLTIHGLGLS